MKPLHQNLPIPATDGTQVIARAKKVFTGHIDYDFKNWNTEVLHPETEATEFAVLELEGKYMTFKQMFTDPEKQCVTQSQIIAFCNEHKDKLYTKCATFFLFKVDNEFFVACVDLVGGAWRAYAYRFSHDYVWLAQSRHRVVVPQLAAQSLISPSPSDSLTLALETVKKAGYMVVKISS